MPEDLKKALIVLFYIYLISAIINIISSYFDFKQGLNEEHYEKYIQKFKNNISIALFPGINILCAGAVIIGIVFFYYDKILDMTIKNTCKKTIVAQKELKILKAALIESKYFENEEEIQLFINGKLVMDKLTNIRNEED
jgi:hypothetical protein